MWVCPSCQCFSCCKHLWDAPAPGCLWIAGEPARIFHPPQIWVLPAPIPSLDVRDVIPRQLSRRCLQPSLDFGPRHRSESSSKEPKEVQARSEQRDLVPNDLFSEEANGSSDIQEEFFGKE